MDCEDEMEDKRLQWTEKDYEKRYQVYLDLDRQLQGLLESVAEPEYDEYDYKVDYCELTNELHDAIMEPCEKLEELAKELLAKEKELEVLKQELEVLKQERDKFKQEATELNVQLVPCGHRYFCTNAEFSARVSAGQLHTCKYCQMPIAGALRIF